MAINPAQKDFTVQRRADFPLTLTFKDGNGDAINLTGYTVAAEVYDESRSTSYGSFTVTYTSRTTGTIDIEQSLMLSHVIFHPVQKSKNRQI